MILVIESSFQCAHKQECSFQNPNKPSYKVFCHPTFQHYSIETNTLHVHILNFTKRLQVIAQYPENCHTSYYGKEIKFTNKDNGMPCKFHKT